MNSSSALPRFVALVLSTALSRASAFVLPSGWHCLQQALPHRRLAPSSYGSIAMASNDPDQDMAASPISATITDVGGFRTTGPDVVNAVKGLGEVASQYDAFLIDQWGVMHNGKTAYPGAVECIDRLVEAGKKIVLLSNSSKRKGAALSNLGRMGFSTDGILDIVTSGQLAWDGLRQREQEPFKSLGTKCLVFGNGDDDTEYVSSCGCELAEAQDADFILARGSFTMVESKGSTRFSPTIMTGEGKAETEKGMQLMVERGAPMLVTNPDFLRPGTNDPMPGLIGRAYHQMGGKVHYVGKPFPAVYADCFRALREASTASSKEDCPEMDLSSIAAVGDSLAHDILGAVRIGIGSVFIAGGVHFEELGVRPGADDVPTEGRYAEAFSKHMEGEGTPTHVLPAFRW